MRCSHCYTAAAILLVPNVNITLWFLNRVVDNNTLPAKINFYTGGLANIIRPFGFGRMHR